jgi:tRNA nucleotidyltransferase/poly(A) polymerase
MKRTELHAVIISAVDKIIQKEHFVKNILQDVVQAGGKMLLVGGSVRDSILEKEIKDLDFEIYALNAQVVQSILQKYGRVDVVGKSFGVFKLQGIDADFALPRIDGAGRKPLVHSDPFLEYSQAFIRRDLTMNAMGIDLQTYELIDPFGGLQDIEKKILRAPDIQFFVQDPLRLFRVMQFAGRFEMSVDDQLSNACQTMSLQGVAQERIYQEFHKICTQSHKPSFGLQWLHQIHRWNEFLPECTDVQNMMHGVDVVVSEKDGEKKEIYFWFMIFLYTRFVEQKDFTTLKKIIFNFVLHQKITDAVLLLIDQYVRVENVGSDFDIKMLAWDVRPYTLQDIVFLLQATGQTLRVEQIKELATKHHVYDRYIDPLVQGADLVHVAQGKQIGDLLKKAYEMQLRFGITDKQDLLQRMQLFEK